MIGQYISEQSIACSARGSHNKCSAEAFLTGHPGHWSPKTLLVSGIASLLLDYLHNVCFSDKIMFIQSHEQIYVIFLFRILRIWYITDNTQISDFWMWTIIQIWIPHSIRPVATDFLSSSWVIAPEQRSGLRIAFWQPQVDFWWDYDEQ